MPEQDDSLEGLTQKLYNSMNAGKGKTGKGGGSGKAPPKSKTGNGLKTLNKQQGPADDLDELSGADADSAVMAEAQKAAAPKKKAVTPSASEGSSSPAAPRASSKGAKKSASARASSPAPAEELTDSGYQPDTSIPKAKALDARRAQLIDELGPQGSKFGQFDQLEQDLPKGDGGAGAGGAGGGGMGGGAGAGAAEAGPMPEPHMPGGGGSGWQGPATVLQLAADLMARSMPNGERSDVPGGSIEANNEMKLRQVTMPQAHINAGYKPTINPVATEVGNRGALPQVVKGPGSSVISTPMNRIMPGSPKDVMDRAEAAALAEQFRKHYPDQFDDDSSKQ